MYHLLISIGYTLLFFPLKKIKGISICLIFSRISNFIISLNRFLTTIGLDLFISSNKWLRCFLSYCSPIGAITLVKEFENNVSLHIISFKKISALSKLYFPKTEYAHVSSSSR